MSRDLVPHQPGRELVEHDHQQLQSYDDHYTPTGIEAATMAQDRRNMLEASNALRRLWGPEYDRKIAINIAALEIQFGEDLAEELLQARMADGRRVADVIEFSAGLSEILFAAYQATTQAGTGGDASLEARRQAIQHIMRTDFQRYHREKLNEEYETILSQLDEQGKL
jgi:hypothetical protein